MGTLQKIKNAMDGLIEAMKAYVDKFNKDNMEKKVPRKRVLDVARYQMKKLTEFLNQANWSQGRGGSATSAASLASLISSASFNQANTSQRRGGLATLAASSASLISSAKERVHQQAVILLGISVKKITLRAKKISTYTQNDKNINGYNWDGHEKFLLTEINKIMLLVDMLTRIEMRTEQARRDRGDGAESKCSKEERDEILQGIRRWQRLRKQSQHRRKTSDTYRKDQEQPLIEQSQRKQSSSCLSSCCLCLFSNKAPSTKGYHQMDDVVGGASSSPENLW